MKIVIISDVLGEENNGTSIATMNLVHSLRNKGHNVSIICPDEEKKDIEGYYIMPKYNFRFLNNYIKKNCVTLGKPDTKIMQLVIKDCDLVHIMLPLMLGRKAAQIAVKMGKPLTAGFHAQAENFSNHLFMMNNFIVNKLTYRFFYNGVYKYCDCIHYPTQFIKDIFEKEIGKTNGCVISNGINKFFIKKELAKPDYLQDKFVILFTGRYSKEKSHKVLIKAVGKSKYKDKIQLIFAGAGPQKEYLQKISKKHLNVQPIFNFYSREDLVNIINYSDLYVHPAEIEIEAISCLEAISCGLVLIIANSPRCATKNFALSEKNLFKNKNYDDLANKIDYWIEHPQEKAACSNAYLGYAKNFEQDECMNKMEQMMIDAIDSKRSSFPLVTLESKELY